MTFINSSCIRKVRYEAGTLYITFRSGDTYPYHGVPIKHYIGLIEAKSKGEYFNTYIRGQY